MKKLILGLFVVFGMASVVNGAMITESNQEKIDKVMAQYKKTLKANGIERPTLEKCNDESDENYDFHYFRSSSICKAERFFNFLEFYKSYGGEFDGHEAFMEAKRDKDSESKYGILSGHNFNDYIYSTHKRLIHNLEQDELRASTIRLNRTGL